MGTVLVSSMTVTFTMFDFKICFKFLIIKETKRFYSLSGFFSEFVDRGFVKDGKERQDLIESNEECLRSGREQKTGTSE